MCKLMLTNWNWILNRLFINFADHSELNLIFWRKSKTKMRLLKFCNFIWNEPDPFPCKLFLIKKTFSEFNIFFCFTFQAFLGSEAVAAELLEANQKLNSLCRTQQSVFNRQVQKQCFPMFLIEKNKLFIVRNYQMNLCKVFWIKY